MLGNTRRRGLSFKNLIILQLKKKNYFNEWFEQSQLCLCFVFMTPALPQTFR